jgi:hypothetical protein
MAPYLPDLNRIKLMFNLYTMSLCCHSLDKPELAHIIALHSVTLTIARNYFRKSCVLGSDELPSEEDETVATAAMVVAMVAAANSMWFLQNLLQLPAFSKK